MPDPTEICEMNFSCPARPRPHTPVLLRPRGAPGPTRLTAAARTAWRAPCFCVTSGSATPSLAHSLLPRSLFLLSSPFFPYSFLSLFPRLFLTHISCCFLVVFVVACDPSVAFCPSRAGARQLAPPSGVARRGTPPCRPPCLESARPTRSRWCLTMTPPPPPPGRRC